MNKKIIICIGILVIIGIIVLFFYLRNKSSSQKIYNPIVAISNSPAPAKMDLTQFTDPSGFAFQYPKSFIASPSANLDDNTYSDITIKSSSKDGSVNIVLTDTDIASINNYIKTNKLKNSDYKNSKLDNLESIQFFQNNSFVTVAIDNGVLIEIKTDYKKSKNDWLAIHNAIINSFKFVPPPTDTTDVSASGDDSDEFTFEGEEIIE